MKELIPPSLKNPANPLGHAIWAEVVSLELRMLFVRQLLEKYAPYASATTNPLEFRPTMRPAEVLGPQQLPALRSDDWLNAYT